MDRTSPHYLIIEKNGFIAADMQQGLADADTRSDSYQIEHVDQLQSFLVSSVWTGRRPVFITKLSIAEIESTGLAGIARRMDGEIVVRMGQDPAAAVTARGWHSLASPFSREDLAGLVDELRRVETCHAAS